MKGAPFKAVLGPVATLLKLAAAKPDHNTTAHKGDKELTREAVMQVVGLAAGNNFSLSSLRLPRQERRQYVDVLIGPHA